jgi:hypothetical protein
MRNQSLPAPVLERLARADALCVVNETRKQILAQRHIEETRAFLLQTLTRGWRRVVTPLFVFLLIFFLCKGVADLYVFDAWDPSKELKPASTKAATDERTAIQATSPADNVGNQSIPTKSIPPPQPTAASPPASENSAWNSFIEGVGNLFIQERRSHFKMDDADGGGHELPRETAFYQMLTAAALLSFAALAGACGAFVSVVNRIQRITDSSKIGRNIWVLKNSSTSVEYAPAIGAAFAVVLSIILAGGLISGSLFPQLSPGKPWFFTFWSAGDMAKWLVWAFIAGFSERLVPDMLDRLTARARNEDKAETITTPPPKVAPTPELQEADAPITRADVPPQQPERKLPLE